MAESLQNSWTVSKEYNEKKCWFLVYDILQEKYMCLSKSFILNIHSSKITGQFLSTNWFKWAFSTEQNVTFMIVFASKTNDSISIEKYVNDDNYHMLHSCKKFTIRKNDMMATYNDMKHELDSDAITKTISVHESESVGYRSCPIDIFTVNVRLYYKQSYTYDNDPEFQPNTLLISLPTFTMDRMRF
jgi:hypothetical protein